MFHTTSRMNESRCILKNQSNKQNAAFSQSAPSKIFGWVPVPLTSLKLPFVSVIFYLSSFWFLTKSTPDKDYSNLPFLRKEVSITEQPNYRNLSAQSFRFIWKSAFLENTFLVTCYDQMNASSNWKFDVNFEIGVTLVLIWAVHSLLA